MRVIFGQSDAIRGGIVALEKLSLEAAPGPCVYCFELDTDASNAVTIFGSLEH